MLQKYAGRVLAITTSACAARCRFCFRRHFPKSRALCPPPSQHRLSTAENGAETTISREYLDEIFGGFAQNSEIRELIFSGGDPLTLSNADLNALLDYIRKYTFVKRVRFHSRTPILCPGRIDADFPDAFTVADSTRGRSLVCHLTLHANVAAEIDDSVEAALLALRRKGWLLTSQSVLLRGVNDSVDALTALFTRLIDCGVIPYYLHQLDRTQGAAHFEVDETRGRALVRELAPRLPGYAVPKYAREIPGRPSKTDLMRRED
ncbi:MAG: radical SAM protein [Thermoguttaceae bacterium]|nr:radical SAM protein [Thermoguttaceae bacterium]